jgi:tripartite ATP-independent transporter DctP family solute receptor
MSRKLFVIALAALFAIGLLAVPAMAKVKFNVGSTFGPGAPVYQGQLKFKELLEKRSNGEIEVLIHPLGAMGGERDVFQAMANGGLEMGAMGSGDISIFFPKYLVFEVPYVLRDYDHFLKFWNGPLGKVINDVPLKKMGVKTVGIVYRGARNLTANRVIKTPADVKGLKLRLPEIKPWMKVWGSLGAQPTPIPFQEVYMALKTGVVEAQENPPESIWSLKFYEAQKYMMKTEHIYAACKYQISMKWFETLDKKTQDLILQCW